MYLDKPLQNYLDDLASAQPAPGGGSAAALSGALGAGLVCMVSRLTLGKTEYAEAQGEIEIILQQAEKLRSRFQELLQADIEAYTRLSACFKLPRGTTEEKAVRTKAIQERLIEAALVPLEMVESAAELIRCCERVAQIGNARVLSDIATGTMLAQGAAQGASWMVYTNLEAMKNPELVQQLEKRLNNALQTIADGSQQVINRVRERV
jgi:formiminotetrahydrofolate cyclodeaminase